MTRDFKSVNWDESMARLHHVIRGRSDIQVAAHDLLHRIKNREIAAPNAEVDNGRYETLVSITFSLWRAVFLADGAGEWPAVMANAEEFLEKVVRDNSITYGDDWKSRMWSFTYYLKNANYRLNELADTWPEFKKQLTPGQLASLNRPVVGTSALELWQDHCTMCQEAIWLSTTDI